MFADKERFHPLTVEAYLACCDLFERVRGWRPRRLRKVTAAWDELAGLAGDGGARERGERRAKVLDRFGPSHFLRFLDPEVRRAERGRAQPTPPWAGFVVLAALVGAGSWYAYRASWVWTGRVLLVLLVGLALVQLLTLMAKRLDLDRALAAFMALLSAGVVGIAVRGWMVGASWRWWGVAGAAILVASAIQVWGRSTFTSRAAAGLNRLSAAPIILGLTWVVLSLWLGLLWVLLVTGLAALVLLVVLSDDLAAAYMAVFSSLRREASAQAVALERELRQGTEKDVYPYYGRVWRDPGGTRIALQYFFFYAFNDWRGQGGLNFHEADWEWATVLLRREGEAWVPEELLLSQHHSVGRRRWDDVELAAGHPVIYVAVGSHANYFEPGRRTLQDLVGESWLKGILTFIFKARRRSREAADEGVAASQALLGRKAPVTEDLSAADDPNGRGLVVGPEVPGGGPGRQAIGWSPVVLDAGQPWIDYRGLWGLRSLLRNESGPPGPQWERGENLPRRERLDGRRRAGWERPLAD